MSDVRRYGHISYLVDATPQMLQLYPSMTVYVMATDYDVLKAENESMRAALKDAEYRADQGKVWNGMGWTYTGLGAHTQQKVLEILRAAISSPENPS